MPIGRSVLQGTPRLAAGQRDKFVTIQQRSSNDAKGASGAPVETWTTLRQVWMARRDTRADERYSGAKNSAAIETFWDSPFFDDVDPETMDVPKLRRLVFGGRIYDILAASRIGRDGIEFMTLASARIEA